MATEGSPAACPAAHLHFLQPLEVPRQAGQAGLHHGVFHLRGKPSWRLQPWQPWQAAPVWDTSCSGVQLAVSIPHLLLEAPIVHLVHSTAGKGLQVLPALAAEEPDIPQVRREVAQAFLEISRVLWGSDQGICSAPSNPSKAPVSPCRYRELWLEPALTLGVFRCSSRS